MKDLGLPLGFMNRSAMLVNEDGTVHLKQSSNTDELKCFDNDLSKNQKKRQNKKRGKKKVGEK